MSGKHLSSINDKHLFSNVCLSSWISQTWLHLNNGLLSNDAEWKFVEFRPFSRAVLMRFFNYAHQWKMCNSYIKLKMCKIPHNYVEVTHFYNIRSCFSILLFYRGEGYFSIEVKGNSNFPIVVVQMIVG